MTGGRRDWDVIELGHANGASADHSRIIRLSYHRPDYVRLAKRAYATWAEVEAEAGGDPIVTVTGGQVRGAVLDRGGAVSKGIPYARRRCR